jgi:hypothetical protein
VQRAQLHEISFTGSQHNSTASVRKRARLALIPI